VSVRRLRWSAVAGAAALAYVVVVALDAVVLAVDRELFTRVHEAARSLPIATVGAIVAFGVVHHVLDGLARLVGERQRPWMQPAVNLLTFALGIPVAVAVLWPSLPWAAA
jgi:hypothetical protein